MGWIKYYQRPYQNVSQWLKIRKEILKEKNHKCEKCNENAAVVHHKDGTRHNHKKNNLMVLCWMCHSKEHKRKSQAKMIFIKNGKVVNSNCIFCGAKIPPKQSNKGKQKIFCSRRCATRMASLNWLRREYKGDIATGGGKK